jgi:hypothetical protein
VVVLSRGGRQATGPRAAAVAGDIYRQLGEKNYFAGMSEDRPSGGPPSPQAVISDSILAGVLILLCSSADTHLAKVDG